jgi:hypothetical protein
VKLDFSGAEIVLSDGGCRVADPQNTLSVQIFVGAGDTSLDDAGTLHAHIAGQETGGTTTGGQGTGGTDGVA